MIFRPLARSGTLIPLTSYILTTVGCFSEGSGLGLFAGGYMCVWLLFLVGIFGLGLVGWEADGLLLGIESRALCRCSKPSTTKQHPWP